MAILLECGCAFMVERGRGGGRVSEGRGKEEGKEVRVGLL